MKVLLGVCGSIGAYKAVEIMRSFQKNDHQVSVVMTESATRLVAPLTFATFLPGRVHVEMFGDLAEPLLHIQLGKDHDMLLIAPATANMIGKITHGIADDLLSTVFMAFPGPVVIAPAMNTQMYANAAVQDNLAKLRERGVFIVEPEEGSLACTDQGKGRLAKPGAIYDFCVEVSHV
jgi:phosphopantothenoylcysteine decarboxylase/phosphopantothenate--cysteine ligase